MEAVVARSIDAFAREEWNRLFPGELEDWSYYRAVERAGLPEFEFLYFGVRVDGALRAALPAFLTDYRLDTTVQGRLKRIADALARWFPRLLRLSMLGLGSPVGEVCHLGFAPDATPAEKQCLLDEILRAAEVCAAERRVRIIAVKDSTATQDALWAEVGRAHRLRRQPGLPTALLDLPFATLDDYLAALGAGTRKDMRRKLRAGAALRIEWRQDIADVADEVMRLYRSTLANAEFQFEELTSAYFTGVLDELGARASCVLYWHENRLAAFNLVLHDGARLLDKFFGMDYELGRCFNLYYLSWMENVRHCLARRIPLYQSGQGLHREKVRLGSRLEANWLWYRHRNRFVDAVFAVLERLARLDRADPELVALTGASGA